MSLRTSQSGVLVTTGLTWAEHAAARAVAPKEPAGLGRAVQQHHVRAVAAAGIERVQRPGPRHRQLRLTL